MSVSVLGNRVYVDVPARTTRWTPFEDSSDGKDVVIEARLTAPQLDLLLSVLEDKYKMIREGYQSIEQVSFKPCPIVGLRHMDMKMLMGFEDLKPFCSPCDRSSCLMEHDQHLFSSVPGRGVHESGN